MANFAVIDLLIHFFNVDFLFNFLCKPYSNESGKKQIENSVTKFTRISKLASAHPTQVTCDAQLGQIANSRQKLDKEKSEN